MDILFVFIVLLIFNQILYASLAKKHAFFNKSLMNKLYFYHLLFFGIYYTYALFNPSDSHHYYEVAYFIGNDWMDYFVTGTKFINFMAAPLAQNGFSYEAVMLIFSWFGYVGFVYAYLFFKENITEKVMVFKKYDMVTLLLFFPNMHFWSVSLGKGTVIFMGLMIFTYAVRFPQKRIIALLIGGFFVYMVRPHVMLFVLVGVMVGILMGRERISVGVRLFVIAASIGFLVAASSSILAVANLEESENVVEDFQDFADKRLEGLSTSGSGVDMSIYPLPVKLFTLWFRPLFVDAPGALGIFSSFENLIYLLLFAKVFNKRFLRFIRKAPYMVKMAAVTFFLSSFALTFVMSNLGIMMRQKAMVMYFGFFVICYFLAEEARAKQIQVVNE
jgi:hypothetical protein